MKKNLILTVIVVALNGWALINLFHFLNNGHKNDSGRGIDSGKNIAIGSSKNIAFSQENNFGKRELSWKTTSIPVNTTTSVLSRGKRGDRGQSASLPVFSMNISNAGSSEFASHLSASRSTENTEAGSSSGSYLLNILENNKEIHQVRLTAIGSQYAYNLSKTSLSEPASANGESGGGVMQKVDDNPGGYNDVPAGNYFATLLVFILSYFLLLVIREKHPSVAKGHRQLN